MKLIIQDMHYRILRTRIICLLGTIFLLGMLSAPKNIPAASAEGPNKASIDTAIADLESVYESRNPENMAAVLDKDYEGRLAFQSSLEDYFLSVKELQIHFVIDSFLGEGDKVDVRLHWFKKSVNNSGGFSKSQGSSQFTFKNTKEGLKLLYIRQDNPFY
jgi:hypothetical protein